MTLDQFLPDRRGGTESTHLAPRDDRLCETPKRGMIYLIAGLSGLRRSEVARLEKRDVNLSGTPTWRLRAEATKSRRQEIIPMLPEAAEKIIEALETAHSETSRLFPEMPTHRTLKLDLQKAGIARKDGSGRLVDFHALRYFFCTLLAKSLPIQTVARLLRHRDIRTTCNLYLDLGLSDIAESTVILPRVFAGQNRANVLADSNQSTEP